jgi:hypothetical protein
VAKYTAKTLTTLASMPVWPDAFITLHADICIWCCELCRSTRCASLSCRFWGRFWCRAARHQRPHAHQPIAKRLAST